MCNNYTEAERVTDLSELRKGLVTEWASKYAWQFKAQVDAIITTLRDAENNVADPYILKRLLDTLYLRISISVVDEIVRIDEEKNLSELPEGDNEE
jgi:hypothetical protein